MMKPGSFRARAVLGLGFVVLAVAFSLVAGLGQGKAAAAEPAPNCRDVSIPVSLTGAGDMTISGSLCWRGGTAPRTVQLLLPGGTYNHVYWDFTYQPETYSYVRAATAAGYATLNIDRLGTGRSSHPAGALLTNEREADSVHQVITALRAGKVGNTAFSRVVLAGHSYGSIVAWYEAGTYRDVDALVITGLLHSLSPTGAATIVTDLYPAAADQKFLGKLVDPAYLTTRPGTRKPFFYRPDTDPQVLAADEATKDTATASEAAGLAVSLNSGMSTRITAPVLIGQGRYDAVFCGTAAVDCADKANVLNHERPHYPAAPCLDAWVSQNSAHDLNTAADAPRWFQAANAFGPGRGSGRRTRALPPRLTLHLVHHP
jgi:pimeloyl-ACP methyl ester carboxylesterase